MMLTMRQDMVGHDFKEWPLRNDLRYVISEFSWAGMRWCEYNYYSFQLFGVNSSTIPNSSVPGIPIDVEKIQGKLLISAPWMNEVTDPGDNLLWWSRWVARVTGMIPPPIGYLCLGVEVEAEEIAAK